MPAARPGPASQEGYPSSSPSLDAHSNEHFNSASNNRRYYDNESDHVEYTRRDYRETYASDTSNTPGNDYDNNGNYEYRESALSLAFASLVSSLARPPQPSKTPTLIPMCTNVQHRHQSR